MSAEHSNHAPSGASVLIVGLNSNDVSRIAAAARPHGVEARATSLAKLQADTAQYRPIVVFVDAYLYDFDPQAFDKLAANAGAKLAVVSNVRDAETLLSQLLNASKSSTPEPPIASPPTSGRREFETAKYDAKTLHEALERFESKETKRAEFVTAKYDAKTLEAALERMTTKGLDSQTSTYDAKTIAAMLEETPGTTAGTSTARYDAKTLKAVLDEMTAKRAETETAHYDAQALLDQIAKEDDS